MEERGSGSAGSRSGIRNGIGIGDGISNGNGIRGSIRISIGIGGSIRKRSGIGSRNGISNANRRGRLRYRCRLRC
jgi:hypothetical protein